LKKLIGPLNQLIARKTDALYSTGSCYFLFLRTLSPITNHTLIHIYFSSHRENIFLDPSAMTIRV
jgi:hypothetical protein